MFKILAFNNTDKPAVKTHVSVWGDWVKFNNDNFRPTPFDAEYLLKRGHGEEASSYIQRSYLLLLTIPQMTALEKCEAKVAGEIERILDLAMNDAVYNDGKEILKMIQPLSGVPFDSLDNMRTPRETIRKDVSADAIMRGLQKIASVLEKGHGQVITNTSESGVSDSDFWSDFLTGNDYSEPADLNEYDPFKVTPTTVVFNASPVVLDNGLVDYPETAPSDSKRDEIDEMIYDTLMNAPISQQSRKKKKKTPEETKRQYEYSRSWYRNMDPEEKEGLLGKQNEYGTKRYRSMDPQKKEGLLEKQAEYKRQRRQAKKMAAGGEVKRDHESSSIFPPSSSPCIIPPSF